MAIQRMDHVGITVADLPAARAFFVALGFTVLGETRVEGEVVDRITALEDVASDVVMLETPGGASRIELSAFRSPPPAPGDPDALVNTLGLRHLCFAVTDLDGLLATARAHGAEPIGEVVTYGTSYKLVYLRGPDGIIVEFAEALGG